MTPQYQPFTTEDLLALSRALHLAIALRSTVGDAAARFLSPRLVELFPRGDTLERWTAMRAAIVMELRGRGVSIE